MQRKLKSPKIWPWMLGMFIIAFLVIGGIARYISMQWKTVLDTRLKGMVVEASDSLYTVSYERLNINAVLGTASIVDLKLTPNQRIYQKLLLQKKAPDNLYQLNIGKVAIWGFSIREVYSEGKLHIQRITISNPLVLITNRRQDYNNRPNTKPKSLYQLVSKLLNEIRIDDVVSHDVNLTFVNRSDPTVKTLSLRHLNLDMRDFLLDSLSERDKSRFYNARKVDFSMNDYRIATADSLYYVNFRKLHFSSVSRSFKVRDITVTPRHSSRSLFRKVKGGGKHFDLEFHRISLDRIDLYRFLADQKLYAGYLEVGKVKFAYYDNNDDANKVAVKKERAGVVLFPHQQLQHVGLDLKIDTLSVREADVGYVLPDPSSGQTGKLTFTRSRVRAFNITNDLAAIQQNHNMRAYVTTYLMNSGRLALHFSFDLSDRLGGFSYSGKLGPMDGRDLNKLTRPWGMMLIKSAAIKSLRFDVHANQHLATGNLEFYYNDLDIQILKRKKRSGILRREGLASELANVFVIRRNNPNAKGKFTPGIIYYRKSPQTSFFSFIWNSLFPAIKQSVGVTPAKEERIQNTKRGIGKTLKGLGGVIKKIEQKRKAH